MAERSPSLKPNPQWASMAVAKAAKPDADEASPAAVGKLLRLEMAKGPIACSRRQSARVRSILASRTAHPFSRSASASASSTLVVVVSASKVMDSDGVAGRFPGPSCLPQYFSRAMLEWATAVVGIGPPVSPRKPAAA